MKKITKMFSIVMLSSFILVGCNDEAITRNANISDQESMLVEGLNTDISNVKLQTIYETLKKSNQNRALNLLVEIIAKKEINFELEENQNWYEKEVNKLMKEKFIDNATYKVDNLFSEELVVKYLKSELYNIDCDNLDEILDQKYFSCNYEEYLNKQIKYQAYENMLIQKYIVEVKSNNIDNAQFREINYISVSKNTISGQFATLDYLLDAINKLEDNTIANLEAIENHLKEEKIIELNNEYSIIADPLDSDYYSKIEKFSKCGSVKCSIEEGFEYQEKLINDKEYIKKEIVNNKNELLFNENVRLKLFSKSIENKIVSINDIDYLTSPSDNFNDVVVVSDALIYDENSSTYYLIQVEKIDSESDFYKLVDVARKMMTDVSKDIAISNFLNKYKIEIFEDDFADYLTGVYTKYVKKD